MECILVLSHKDNKKWNYQVEESSSLQLYECEYKQAATNMLIKMDLIIKYKLEYELLVGLAHWACFNPIHWVGIALLPYSNPFSMLPLPASLFKSFRYLGQLVWSFLSVLALAS